jgi:hypothetical protein
VQPIIIDLLVNRIKGLVKLNSILSGFESDNTIIIVVTNSITFFVDGSVVLVFIIWTRFIDQRKSIIDLKIDMREMKSCF